MIMAIANSNKDDSYSTNTSQMSTEPRVLKAKEMLEELKREQNFKEIITELEFMCEALIELAYLKQEDCKNIKTTTYEIPRRAKLRSIKNFSHILLPTLQIPIKKNCNYDDIIGLSI